MGNFVEFIQKNITLQKLKTGLNMSTKAAANFTRNELAYSLRKGPFQADLLIAGFDESGPGLYYLDYLASMEKVNKAAQGYGAFFTLGLMDRYYKPDLNLQEAKVIINLGDYKCKVVDKDGIREISLAD